MSLGGSGVSIGGVKILRVVRNSENWAKKVSKKHRSVIKGFEGSNSKSSTQILPLTASLPLKIDGF